jgi:hypothetical protein
VYWGYLMLQSNMLQNDRTRASLEVEEAGIGNVVEFAL